MNQPILTRDLIAQTHLWEMALRIDSRSIEAVFLPPVANQPPMWRSVEVRTSPSDPFKGVKDAIFDNPLLLSDFKRVCVLIDTPRLMFLPPEVAADSAAASAALALIHPGERGPLLRADTAMRNAVLVMEPDREMESFLRRTFFNLSIGHPLASLCRLAAPASRREETPLLLARRREGCVDVVGCDADRLLVANSFACETLADTLYYIAATLRQAETDSGCRLNVRVSGSPDIANNLAQMLGPARSVAPFELPPELWSAGSMAAEMPIDLLAGL